MLLVKIQRLSGAESALSSPSAFLPALSSPRRRRRRPANPSNRLQHVADGRARPQRQVRPARPEGLGGGYNAKGGLLGRPVKLIYYDDQTNPATVPSIYAKLLDVDKVDLIIGPYATNLQAPAMPIAMQRKKVFIGLLGTAVNSTFNYPNYFSMAPNGPEPKRSYTKGFVDLAVRQNPKPQTVAIVAADAEFALNVAEGARENVKAAGLTIVYDRNIFDNHRPRAGGAGDCRANPDLAIIFSYPPELGRHGAGGQRGRV